VNAVLYGMKIGFAVWLGFGHYRPIDEHALQKEAHQAVFNRHWLSTSLLSANGSDSGEVAAITEPAQELFESVAV